MIPEDVLAEALKVHFKVPADVVEDRYALIRQTMARQLLARCHEIQAQEPMPDAAKLLAAVQVIEDFLRRSITNQVQIRHYFATAFSLEMGQPIEARSERKSRRLADAMIKLAEALVKVGQ